jgi:hypothetical protein
MHAMRPEPRRTRARESPLLAHRVIWLRCKLWSLPVLADSGKASDRLIYGFTA